MEPRSARPAGFRVHGRGIRTHEASRTLMRLAVPAYLVLPSGLRMTTSTSPLGCSGSRMDLTSAALTSNGQSEN